MAELVWTAGLVLLACRGPKTEIVPEQVTVKYCLESVQVHDVEQCVTELKPEQQRRRAWTKRLTYRGTKLVRRELVSGSGELANVDVENYEYAGNRISAALHSSRTGVANGRETFSTDRSVVRYVDELGRPKIYREERASSFRRQFDMQGRVVSTAWLDVGGNPLSSGEVYEVRETRRTDGLPLEFSYFGRNGEPVKNVDGAHREVVELDAEGLRLARRCFDEKAQPSLCYGAHTMRFRYDDARNPIEVSFFGVDDRPVASTGWGAAVVRYTRDARGNVTATRLYDEGGKPVLGSEGYASSTQRFDAQDRTIEHAYFGVDGAPIRLPSNGAAIVRHTYDARGNVDSTRFLDEDGARVLCSDGYFRSDLSYDARDNPISFRFSDLAEQPVPIAGGYALKKIVYDGDRVVSHSLFDASGRPVVGREGYARAELSYDANGKDDKWRYFDADGKEDVTRSDCHGSLTPELKEELGSRHDSMRSCYQTLLGRNPKAQGKIVVALQIGERGEVSSTKVERDELGSATMVECVLAKLRSSVHHRPEHGCVSVRLPIRFVQKKSE